MDEHIRQVQLRAYHEGYIAGYQRGMEDGRAGMQTPPALLDCPLHFLNLSTRPFNSLDRAGYRTVGDIVSLNRQEIWKIRSLGKKVCMRSHRRCGMPVSGIPGGTSGCIPMVRPERKTADDSPKERPFPTCVHDIVNGRAAVICSTPVVIL